MADKKLLILGGTGDAAKLARQCVERFRDRLDVIVSYAGVTGHQPDLPCRVRVGGFGGQQGLIDYISAEGISHIIDATHPFAEKISHSAFVTAASQNLPLVCLSREEWKPVIGDHWLWVDSLVEAAEQVRNFGVKTFLTTGIKELHPFKDLDNIDLVVRIVNQPKEDLPLIKYECVVARGPFSLEEERTLLRDKHIRLMVCKNSGGEATRAKLDAAREEGVTVIMVRRPLSEPIQHLYAVQDALNWLASHGC